MSRRQATKPPAAKNGDLKSEPPAPIRDPRALSRLDWIALGLLAAALGLAPFWAGTFSNGPLTILDGLGLPLILGLIVGALGVVFWREWKRPVRVGAVPGLAGAFSLLGLWAIVSLLRSRAVALSLEALAALLAALLCGGLVSRLARDRMALQRLLLVLIGAGTLVSVLGIQEYLFKALPPPRGEGDFHWRVFATFINPDFLAGYLLLIVPLTLSAFAAAEERTLRLVLGIALALQSGCLMLTGSRTGVAILAAALLAWLGMTALSGAASGRKRQVGLGLAVLVVSTLLASLPLLGRFSGRTTHAAGTTATLPTQANSLDAQSHSGAFRRYTWIGTIRMAKANPVFGTGIGTFSVAYPRYAETAYTAHAHNSYLQWLGDTGVPGALLLLTGLAAATAFSTHILFLKRGVGRGVLGIGKGGASQTPTDLDTEESNTHHATPNTLPFREPRLILAGLVASVLATLLHSLIDSDWYILATLFTLSAVVGLMVAQARDIAPLATQMPQTLGQQLMLCGGLVAAFILWQAVAMGISRSEMAAGLQAAFVEQNSQAALAAFQTAAAAAPFDPEPRLRKAQIYAGMRQTQQAREAFEEAARIGPTGKSLYQLGQFYAAAGEREKATGAFERALDLEPHNVQTLRALADNFLAAGQPERAATAWRTLIQLEQSPYGTVRAMPELVETEFAVAHARLGDAAFEAGKWADADVEYAQAAKLLREFWRYRNTSMGQQSQANPVRFQTTVSLYDHVLTRRQETLQKLGRTAEAAPVAEEQTQFQRERDEEQRQKNSVMEGQEPPAR